MKLTMNQKDLAEWIQEASNDAVMLTISRPHAKANYLAIEATHMEPVISRIVGLANRYVFGTHKRFNFLTGIVVQEGGRQFPHFHVVFQKPVRFEMDIFIKKLTQLATRLCDEKFEFDLSESYLPDAYRKVLSTPCYCDFARASATHERLGRYLTAEHAKYYELTGRDFLLDRDQVEIRVDFYNNQPNHTKAVADALLKFQSRQSTESMA